MLIISAFCWGSFQQKVLIVSIVLRLRMSAYAYAPEEISLYRLFESKPREATDSRSPSFFFLDSDFSYYCSIFRLFFLTNNFITLGVFYNFQLTYLLFPRGIIDMFLFLNNRI